MSALTTLPQALHAENTVLGAMLSDEVCLNEAVSHLREQDFSLTSHRTIFRAMREMAEVGTGVDLVTVGNKLTEKHQLEDVGGMPYLFSLTDGIPRHPSIGDYSRILRRKSTARAIMYACEEGLKRGADESEDPQDTLTYLSDVMTAELAGTGQRKATSAAEHTATEMERFAQQAKSPELSMGLPYGNARLDAHSNGMQPGEVTVIGARSGVGKTALMVQAVHETARNGIGVDVFSLEAPASRILRHLWAIEADVPYFKVRKPHLCQPDDVKAIRAAAMRVADWNMRIHDSSDMTVSQIAAYARLGIRQHGTKLVAVDYAQIVDAPGKDDRLRVSNVSRTLTRMTKAEGTSLLLLSQLAKVSREYYGKAPTINDLRETGQLENDAHVVLLLHRTYDQESGKMSEESEIHVPKMRDGEPGIVPAKFCKRSLRFL